ncbi:MAG: hypothetical protein OHK0022_34640 [Roseiflexaceae bacterium]
MEITSGTVLVVDDDAGNRELLERRLRRYGCRVLLAEDGVRALQIVRDAPPDLVLLDIIMPELDGFAVLERLKADPSAKHIPVVVISADQDLDSVTRCITLGAEDYLSKPFNPVLLKARVGACLEKKRLRDQEQAHYAAVQAATAAKNEFISVVAHELKVPMTSIRGYTDILLSGMAGPVSETQNECLQTIREGVERMRMLVADLTDISRIESGDLGLEIEAVSLAVLIEEAASTLRAEVEQKRQTLLLLLPEGLAQVRADRRRVLQILTNLLSNAHKYTPEGGEITVRTTVEPSADEPIHTVVHVAVQDTGLGISAEDQERIFQRFFRSGDRRVRAMPGTGLGLSITRHLVELQGGRIWFESTLGHGTTFHFTLPAVR